MARGIVFHVNESSGVAMEPGGLSALAEFVTDEMQRQGIKRLEDIRQRGGPSIGWLSGLLNGTSIDRPKPETLQKLAKSLGVQYGWLLVMAGYIPEGTDFFVDQEDGSATLVKASSIPSRRGKASSKRGLRLVERPFAGAVNCGEPIDLEEPQPIEVPEELAHLADFVVQARGQSMTSYRINPGDLLYVKRVAKPKAALGQIVIAHVKGEGATCKLIEQIGSDIMLMSLGKERPKPRKVDEDVIVLGVVKWVVPRGFDPMESGGAPF